MSILEEWRRDTSEEAEAMRAAMVELFRQYPPCEPVERSLRWRKIALQNLSEPNTFGRYAIGVALHHARDTGVPNELLNALRGLLRE